MSKLKCPFCQQELERNDLDVQLFGCENQNCKHSIHYDTVGTKDLWQELIRAREALDIAWDGLKKIGSGDIIEHSVVGHENDNKISIANKALDESKTALEQKDVK